MKHNDPRNLIDDFKGMKEEDIVKLLDKNGVSMEIAIENLERDFNMGSIVRSANAFGVRRVHVIGRRQWNKRGAMATDRYLHILYHENVSDFVNYVHVHGMTIVCIDNVDGAKVLHESSLPSSCVLVFGSESNGVSETLLARADVTLAIAQYGSTRSMNVAAAAAVAMYEWMRQHKS